MTQISAYIVIYMHVGRRNKNTLFLLGICIDIMIECIHVSVFVQSLSRVQVFVAPWLKPVRLLCPWNSPCKNTGESCHSLLQGIFPTQRLNLHLSYCRWILYC